MTKYYWILCFLFFVSVHCISQVPDSFPSVDESDLPDAAFKIPKTYTGASLLGYINGGAELYFEYGFSDAWVNEIRLMGGKYITEIYRMKGPEEAFGIFSVSRFQCGSTPSMSPFTCQTPYQLQICAGSFYINIINKTGNSTDSITSLKIGEAIVGKIKEKPADITYYLPDISPETINREAVLVKGKLGIMNGAPDLVDYFGDAKGYYAIILRHETEIILSVRFLSEEDRNAFASLHSWDSETISAGSGKMLTGETITKISDHHLLIKIEE
ncbi:MAG: hypothetical protein JW973_08920 [Bacteroidales bacterium]|nr:hypothetical protein [Bacteroidales bacterium]